MSSSKPAFEKELFEFVDPETGELVELEMGIDDLAPTVAEFTLSRQQIGVWTQRKVIASAKIMALQTDKVQVYNVPVGGDVRVNIVGGRKTKELDREKFNDVEFTQGEMRTLIENATGFNWEGIDPGLKGSDPKKWKPTTPLGRTIAICLTIKQGEPYVLANPVAKIGDPD